MTKEEKKAIEEIKKFKFTESEKAAEENGLEHAEFARFLTIYHRKQLNILLNLIEKLQKENEELKKEKVTYLDKVYDKIDNFKYEYKKAERQHAPERASFYRDLIRHFEKLLEEE